MIFFNKIFKIFKIFSTIEIYEKKNNLSLNFSKKYKLKIYKNFFTIKQKEILNYFETYKHKKKRFSNNCTFLALTFNHKLVSSGWLYRGKNWKITEIDYMLKVTNKFIIFDFITSLKHRNKGYYTQLLKLISSKFKNQNILIYVLSSNKNSKRAIIKAGFKYKKKIRKIKLNEK